MPILEELRTTRINKLNSLKKAGINPYPAVVKRNFIISQATQLKLGTSAELVGRIMSIRGHGKILFFDIIDESGKIQAVFKSDKISEDKFKLLELIDIADFMAVQGLIGKTEAGEISVFVEDYQIIHKTLRPLPDQWYGFKDIEERYRKRYIDILINPNVKKILDARWNIEKAIREFMWSENYKEVETPVLQPLYGGTNAKPFKTHMNALDTDFYLRLAPELYLKRLIVGGYERVFEIARNFRNEGTDLTHQPEFTMMEFYEAYADYQRIMDLTEGLFKYVTQKVFNSSIIQIDKHEVDLSVKWRRITIDEAMKEYEGIEWDKITDKDINNLLEKHQIQVAGNYTRNKALFMIYDHLVTPKLIKPTWVTDYPQEVSPLSKEHRSKPGRVERFEGYIGGREICDGWSEIVSGLEQRDRFEQEQKNMRAGDEEAQPLDEDFITALEYGCPPLGGIGIGIDRMVMLLTNTWAIREVIPFPTLRPVTLEPKPIPKEKIPVKDKPKVKITNNGANHYDLTRDSAMKLVREWTKNPNLVKHMLAVEVIMKALARHFDEDGEQYAIVGLLHDLDYEKLKDNPEKHPFEAVAQLKKLGVDPKIVQAVLVHAWGWRPEIPEPSSNLEWSIYTCDELSGLITACALVRPDKQLSSVTVESVLKKFPQKAFAAGAKRENIMYCESKLGIKLSDFIAISLKAMQDIHGDLGL